MTVPDYQLSLAIGKEGQNARLAARLTGWRIDIRPDTETRASPASPPKPAGRANRARSTAGGRMRRDPAGRVGAVDS